MNGQVYSSNTGSEYSPWNHGVRFEKPLACPCGWVVIHVQQSTVGLRDSTKRFAGLAGLAGLARLPTCRPYVDA
jgi:hypothetical protein